VHGVMRALMTGPRLRVPFGIGVVLAIAFASHAPLSHAQNASPGPSASPSPSLSPSPPCANRQFSPANPDTLNTVWDGRQRYRLVIGASTFSKTPSANRDFVEPTARLVDEALDNAGYTHSLGLLIGAAATKRAVNDALASIGSLPPTALVVIYYIGHGIPTADKSDVAVAVADEPVIPGSGLPVRQLLATALLPFDPAFRKFPRITLILETCFSGGAVVFSPGYRSVIENQPTDFRRLAFMSATSDKQQAYPLRNQKVSAFGHFFAQALGQEWNCADAVADGALTVAELATYIGGRLSEARTRGEIDGDMTPDQLDRGSYSMIAYDKARVADLSLYRRKIEDLYSIDVDGMPSVTLSIESLDGKVLRQCTVSCSLLTDSPATVQVRAQLPGFSVETRRLDGIGRYDIRMQGIFGNQSVASVQVRKAGSPKD
jgi:hypothetical protein